MNPYLKKLRASVARFEEPAAAIRAAADPFTLAASITAADLYCAIEAPRTDLGNAERLLIRFGDRLLDVVGLGVMQWTGAHWRPDGKEGALDRAAHETARVMAREAQVAQLARVAGLIDHYPTSRKDARDLREKGQVVEHCYEDVAAWAKSSQSAKSTGAMAKMARAYLQVDAAKMDAQPHILGVQNGMVDLRTGELLPADPAALLTKISPIDYDPTATCPTWERALGQAMLGDADLLDYVQRMSGYVMTGETREQCFFFLTGHGSNSKGVFTGTLRRLLPDHTRELPKDLLMKQRGSRKEMGGTNDILAGLRSARFLHAEETDSDDVLDEAAMKLISGEGVLSASFKYERNFEFRPIGKIVADMNFRPRIHSQDKAIWRRVVDVPFRAHFANPEDEGYEEGVSLPKDPCLGDKLTAELPGMRRDKQGESRAANRMRGHEAARS